MDEKVIATIPKNTMEEVRVFLAQYKGYHLEDARLYIAAKGRFPGL